MSASHAELPHLTVDPCPDKAILVEFLQFLFEFTFSAANDGSQDHHPFALRQFEYPADDLFDGLPCNRSAALVAVRLADG